jgi:hypothetical protein
MIIFHLLRDMVASGYDLPKPDYDRLFDWASQRPVDERALVEAIEKYVDWQRARANVDSALAILLKLRET